MQNNMNPGARPLGRRQVLTGLGAMGLTASFAMLLQGCSPGENASGSNDTTAGKSSATTGAGGTTSAATGSVAVTSNLSNAVPEAAFADVVARFTETTGIDVSVNTIEHNTFQDNIQSYLQGNPGDVVAWFAGYRMRYFAEQGLIGPIDDAWADIENNFAQGIRDASKGDDGKYYFVPLYTYPWVMTYRRSLFEENGYEVPDTWDELTSLCDRMEDDGLVPMGWANMGGWPAMGTFDILNMRMNGYDFHVDLMAHKIPWTDPAVEAVFQKWTELTPYYQTGANGRSYQESAQDLQNKKIGMMFQGAGQVGQQFSEENLPDLAFFPFPEINPEFGKDSIDAPIDGFMMPNSPANREGALELLRFIGTAEAQEIFLETDPTLVGLAEDYDTSTYNDLQKASAEIIGNTAHLAQFLDRDTRPDFAFPIIQNAIQSFITKQDPKAVCEELESQAKTVFID